MNYKDKERVEKCVVQVECVNKYNTDDKEFGTGFFIDKDKVVTASHVINKYYTNPSDYYINVIHIKAGIDKEIKVVKNIELKQNNFVSILELEEEVENINLLKFTSGYEVKIDDKYYTFGFPQQRRSGGIPIENKIETSINEMQSRKIDWSLSLSGERLEDFKGLSGSPVIINNMLVGIIQTQSEANSKTTSLGISSISMMKEYISEEFIQDIHDIFDINRIIDADEYRVFSIDDVEKQIEESTNPSICLDFFEIDDKEFLEEFRQNLSHNMYIVGKSREETLNCILNELKYNLKYDNVVIVGDERSWEELRDNIDNAILIPNFYVGEIVAIKNNINIFIYGEDEHCTNPNKIELKRRTRNTIIKKLEKAGLDIQDAYDYVEKTNGLFISLKRKLFNGQYNILPEWHNKTSNSFAVALLCGKWTECDGDKKIIEELSGMKYDEFMMDLIPFIKGREPFIIEILDFGKKRYQLANVEISWEYLDGLINKNIWNNFKAKLHEVITEIDPIFNRPYEEHYMASFSKEKSQYSNELKLGMIRSLIFRAIYRGNENQYEIDKIIEDLLSTVNSPQSWAYISQYFPELCEASPKSVITCLQKELKNPTGLVKILGKGSKDIIMGRHYYTNILWAVEQLLLYKEYASIAVRWLLEVDNLDIKYTISNSPRETLKDVFCAWFNISVITKEDKIKLSQYAMKKYKNTWDLIFNELPGGNNVIKSSGSKPKYRKCDEVQTVTNKDVYELYTSYANMCIDNINGDIDRWLKMINKFSIFPNDMLDVLMLKLSDLIEAMNDTEKMVIKNNLRSELYRHRYFSNSGWSMDEARLEKIEALLLSITFNNKEHDYTYLFIDEFDMPILNPIPYNDNNSSIDENRELKENEIRERFIEFIDNNLDLSNLIRLVDKKNYHNLGMYIAKYYTNGKFSSLIYVEMLKISGIQQVLYSYVSYLYRNGEDKVIKEAKQLSKKYDGKDELYVGILTIENLKYDNHPGIIDESEDIKLLYWSYPIRSFRLERDKKTFEWCLCELKKYGNGVSYIECLYMALEIFEPKEVLKYMIDLKEFNGIKLNNQMSGWYVKNIMEYIGKNFEGNYELYNDIASLELSLRGVIEWGSMKCAQYIMKKDPQLYADIINIIYLHEGEDRNDKTKEDYEIVQSLFNFYYKIHFCPCENNGDIDYHELKDWVDKFNEKLIEQKQSNLLGHELGRLFAYSPVGEDGYYPHESVRDIIEELADDKLRSSYVSAECNKRGVYSPDAGRTEKEMALRYKENADGVRTVYPETAKIYDSLYERYYYQSEAERRRAEDAW
ncbi:MAG: trypsin-like peptidase domain-containing protein [Romboutsia sp.]|uniref:S1 family peptidase n=1 Tax=Romboutsia sp. TaxID=1965302 RepID=UPI00216D779D|nr:serine protease [Romboutsia sp.]MCI9258717.1 trypsin-like peptidase domain-containing protein [Romboutsia sp.]